MLDTEILRLCTEEALTVNNGPNPHERQEPDPRVEDGGDPGRTRLCSDPERTSDCNHVEQSGRDLESECEVSAEEESVSLEKQTETDEDTKMENDKGKEETKTEWITVGSVGSNP